MFPEEVMLLLYVEDCGFKESILEKAKSMLDTNTICMEEVLKSIYDDKIKIEEEKAKTIRNSIEIENLKKKLELDTTELEQKASEILENAKLEARQILISAKEDANDIIRELENMNSASSANKLRNSLNKKINETVVSTSNNIGTLEPKDIYIGQPVFILPIKQVATVLSLPNKSGEVNLQVGNSKMYFNVKELSPAEHTKTSHVDTSKKASSFKSYQISSEIKLLGTTVEEANVLIDKYLDDASLAGLSTVRIVHGKGTGMLRKGIHAYLKKHPHVKSFRLAGIGEGDMGVTIVEIK